MEARRLDRAAGYVAAAYLALFFVVPVLRLLYRSLISPSGAFSLHNFASLLASPLYQAVLVRTLEVAFASTFLALLLGYPLAMYIAGARRMRGMLLTLAISPMLISLTVRLFGWMIVLSDNGPVNHLLMALGLTDAPVKLLFTRTAVVIGIAAYALPYVVLVLYSAIRRVDTVLQEAAATLGAAPWYSFTTVLLPLTVPGIVAAGSIAFALGASAFIVPLMLGGPKDALLANYAYSAINTLGDWGQGAAVGALLLVLVSVALWLANRVERRAAMAK